MYDEELDREKMYSFTSSDGTEFSIFPDGTKRILVPPQIQAFDVSREKAVAKLALTNHISIDEVKNYFRDEGLKKVLEFLEKDLTGIYFGITFRNQEEIEEGLPGVISLLKQERGKVGILGNGLSAWPLSNSDIDITLIDRISYQSINQSFKEMANDSGIAPELVDKFQREAETARSIASLPNIHTRRYMVGLGDVPEELKEQFDLLINAFGPPPHKYNLDDMLTMLAPGGELWITETPDVIERQLSKKNIRIIGIYNTNGK